MDCRKEIENLIDEVDEIDQQTKIDNILDKVSTLFTEAGFATFGKKKVWLIKKAV